MGSKLNQTLAIAITLSVVVFAIVLYMLVKISGKRVNINGGKVYKNRRHGNKMWKKGATKFHVVLPEFPHAKLSESLIQPEIFHQTPKVIEDNEELSHDYHQNFAGTLFVNLRYDLMRSALVILLVKARDLPTNEANEYNYYIIINLFPQKHKPFQSAVYKTSSPGFGESFEFPIPSQYLLLQSLKFSLWSFDRFSHHDVMADTLVQLQELETYGLSIGRDVSLGKTLKLVQKVSDVCGDILFSLGYLRLAQRLAVVVIKVIQLGKIKINNESPDPFVEVSLLRKDKRIKVQRTSTKKRDQNPKYNETLTFDVPIESLHESSLLICVLSKTKESYLEENLGNVLLGADASGEDFDHWEDMRTGTKPKARWHKLRKHF